MSYQSTINTNQSTLEYGKFVTLQDDARFPPISVVHYEYPDMGTPGVSSLSIYPKSALITYLANASDIKLTLSASEVDIGNVGVVDHYTTGFDTYGSVIYTNTAPGGQLMGAVSVKTYGVSPVSGNVTITNPVTALQVTNTVTISTAQTLPISGNVYVTNPNVTNTVSISTAQTLAVSGSVTIVSPVTSVVVSTNSNTLAVSGSVTVTNPISSVTVTNTVAISTTQTLPISGSVTVLNPVSTVNVTGSVATNFNPTQVDAFNRLRVSNPLTLFDSSHRFKDNNLWSSLTANGGTVSFNLTQGLMDLNVTNTAGASALRETTKVFAYQPGKSLLVMNTFVMGASATGLVQRVGYFGNENGIFFQMEDDVISFVERSIVTGSLVNTVTPRSSWNGDKLDGTGPSGITLDITKAQIMWMDIEWLGVGTIRTGLIINGQFITCHSFHHANIINSTYITTASLPLRYEIFNKSATAGSKTLKQICSTVISEGGYELRGLQQAIGTPITTAKQLTTAGTFYPVVTLRLNPNRLDGIVILTALSIMGRDTGIYNWQVIASGTTTGGSGTWVDAGVDSSVQYKLDATGITGGRILASGFTTANTQAAPSIDILKEALFKFQLERNIFTGTPFELTLAVAASTNTELVYGSMDWEEVSR